MRHPPPQLNIVPPPASPLDMTPPDHSFSPRLTPRPVPSLLRAYAWAVGVAVGCALLYVPLVTLGLLMGEVLIRFVETSQLVVPPYFGIQMHFSFIEPYESILKCRYYLIAIGVVVWMSLYYDVLYVRNVPHTAENTYLPFTACVFAFNPVVIGYLGVCILVGKVAPVTGLVRECLSDALWGLGAIILLCMIVGWRVLKCKKSDWSSWGRMMVFWLSAFLFWSSFLSFSSVVVLFDDLYLKPVLICAAGALYGAVAGLLYAMAPKAFYFIHDRWERKVLRRAERASSAEREALS